MSKKAELNILAKQIQLEELLSINQEITANYEKTITLLKDGGSLSEQFIKTKSEYHISTLTYEADNNIKMIDVYIDILKFLIPTLFSLWTVTRIIPQFSGTSNFVFGMFSFCLVLLVVAIFIRMQKVKSYVSKFKDEQRKFALECADWQKHMAEIEALELDTIKKRHDQLKKQYDLISKINKT